jgi:hypothetical protein
VNKQKQDGVSINALALLAKVHEVAKALENKQIERDAKSYIVQPVPVGIEHREGSFVSTSAIPRKSRAVAVVAYAFVADQP